MYTVFFEQFAVIQMIKKFLLLWNPKVHCVHKSLPLDPILRHINQADILKIPFNIMLSSVPKGVGSCLFP